jgi:hypothetical protein
MVANEHAPSPKEHVHELVGRLGVALCARALWDLIERLLLHRGIDI